MSKKQLSVCPKCGYKQEFHPVFGWLCTDCLFQFLKKNVPVIKPNKLASRR